MVGEIGNVANFPKPVDINTTPPTHTLSICLLTLLYWETIIPMRVWMVSSKSFVSPKLSPIPDTCQVASVNCWDKFPGAVNEYFLHFDLV